MRHDREGVLQGKAGSKNEYHRPGGRQAEGGMTERKRRLALREQKKRF